MPDECSSQHNDVQEGIRDVGFVSVTKEYPVVLSKSQRHKERKHKSEALTNIQQTLAKKYVQDLKEAQILKKIHHMKTRLKKETEINKTENRKIALNNEQKLL